MLGEPAGDLDGIVPAFDPICGRDAHRCRTVGRPRFADLRRTRGAGTAAIHDGHVGVTADKADLSDVHTKLGLPDRPGALQVRDASIRVGMRVIDRFVIPGATSGMLPAGA